MRMTDVNGKEIKVGSVVISDARKTACYVVTEVTDTGFNMQRVKKDGKWTLVPSHGYRVANRQIVDLHFKVVGERAGTVAPAPRPTTTKKTIDDLWDNPWLYSRNIVREFFYLIRESSPENIWCDGEASAAQAHAKEREIARKWACLENFLGVKVSTSWPSDKVLAELNRN